MMTPHSSPMGSDQTMPILRPMFRATRLAVPLVAMLVGCGKSDTSAAAETPPVQISSANIAVVDSALIESGPTLSGSLEAERAAQLRAQVGGTLLALYVEEGASVAAGQALALIDTMTIAEQARSARSQLRSAQASADMARRNSERAEVLHKAGAIADRDLEAAKSGEVAGDANLADAKSRLASAEKQFADATVRAPFRGVVSERPASVGDALQPGSPILTVIDPSQLKLEASVPSDHVSALRVGSKVEFTVQGSSDKRFTGRIASINPAVDPTTRQVRVYVLVPNSGNALVAGLFAEGRVALESVRALSIPFGAIDERATTPSVKRLRGGKVESVSVGLGIRDELAELVEITSGLTRGDTLLVGGVIGTPAGTTLRVVRRDR